MSRDMRTRLDELFTALDNEGGWYIKSPDYISRWSTYEYEYVSYNCGIATRGKVRLATDVGVYVTAHNADEIANLMTSPKFKDGDQISPQWRIVKLPN